MCLQQRACQRLDGADVRFARARANHHADGGSREVDAAAGEHPALRDQIVQGRSGQDHDVRWLAPGGVLVADDAGTDGTTAWYMVADPDIMPSIVRVFLQGNRTPTLERSDPVNTLGLGWRCYFDAGASAVNWRGLIRSDGV